MRSIVRLVPAGIRATTAGYCLLLAGMLFAAWARVFLGGNWSSSVTLKQDHTLVRSGPYRIVRHPDLYRDCWWPCWARRSPWASCAAFSGVVLAAIAWKMKSITEEALMVQQFGDQYTRYRMEVKALVPYIW